MSGDPKESHREIGGDVIQRHLALPYQCGLCFSSLKSFQSCLTIRPNTNLFLWSSINLYFISTGQDSLYLALENCYIFS
jgi:hypothetical protein